MGFNTLENSGQGKAAVGRHNAAADSRACWPTVLGERWTERRHGTEWKLLLPTKAMARPWSDVCGTPRQ